MRQAVGSLYPGMGGDHTVLRVDDEQSSPQLETNATHT